MKLGVRNTKSYQPSVLESGNPFCYQLDDLRCSEVLVTGPGQRGRGCAAIGEGALMFWGHLIKLLLKEAAQGL